MNLILQLERMILILGNKSDYLSENDSTSENDYKCENDNSCENKLLMTFSNATSLRKITWNRFYHQECLV